MPAQATVGLNDERRAALRARGRSGVGDAAGTGDEHLSFAATVPVHGDSLATKLVRELIRSFDVERDSPDGFDGRLAWFARDGGWDFISEPRVPVGSCVTESSGASKSFRNLT